jgi:hypothetical protein
MSNFIIYLIEKDILTQTQSVKAFKRLHDRLSDLILDVPTAGATLAQFTAWAMEEKILPSNFSFDE